MKKILLPIAVISLILLAGACGNASKQTAQPASSSTEEAAVDQSAGYQVIEALSKIYSDHPNTIGDFIGNERCPSFLEGMYFDGGTLVFQVRGDTILARRKLEIAAGSGAFRLEQVEEGTYSAARLKYIMNEINQRYDALPKDCFLKQNMSSWGASAHDIRVEFIYNTPEARREFREKLSDLPIIRFEGPEEPGPNPMVGVTETLGISLHPEYSVYSTQAETATFVLLNQSSHRIECGESYSITYEDEKGTWRTLPTSNIFNAVAYAIQPGGHKVFKAWLYPKVHPNKAGRYRYFHRISSGQHGVQINMMAEFRLTDNEQEVKRAVRMEIPKDMPILRPDETEINEEDMIYQIVEEMPEFPGGMSAFIEYIKANIRYPEKSRKNGVQGRVIVRFVIMKDGSIEQAHIIRGINSELDEEALRVISSMPRWKPGKQEGKERNVEFTVPVTFRLE